MITKELLKKYEAELDNLESWSKGIYVHPGEVLLELYLKPHGIKLKDFAYASCISNKHLSRIVNGKSRIGIKAAVKIAKTLGTSVELWTAMQLHYDMAHIRVEHKKTTAS